MERRFVVIRHILTEGEPVLARSKMTMLKRGELIQTRAAYQCMEQLELKKRGPSHKISTKTYI
jgi:hypothetical protein